MFQLFQRPTCPLLRDSSEKTIKNQIYRGYCHTSFRENRGSAKWMSKGSTFIPTQSGIEFT